MNVALSIAERAWDGDTAGAEMIGNEVQIRHTTLLVEVFRVRSAVGAA